MHTKSHFTVQDGFRDLTITLTWIHPITSTIAVSLIYPSLLLPLVSLLAWRPRLRHSRILRRPAPPLTATPTPQILTPPLIHLPPLPIHTPRTPTQRILPTHLPLVARHHPSPAGKPRMVPHTPPVVILVTRGAQERLFSPRSLAWERKSRKFPTRVLEFPTLEAVLQVEVAMALSAVAERIPLVAGARVLQLSVSSSSELPSR